MRDKNISCTEGKGQYVVYCNASEIGRDLVVTLHGGDRPHVGAVALGIPRPSLADAKKISASVSVLTLTGHKEDELAKMTAHRLASTLNRVTVVTAGLHIDHISQEGIETLKNNAVKVSDRLLQILMQGSEDIDSE